MERDPKRAREATYSLEARETGRRPPAASTDERAPAVESSDPSASDATAGQDAVETRGTTVPVDDALPPAPLRLPVSEADARAMKGQFGDRRDRGARGHEAVDILAPRNTPVHAVDDGTVAKLFFSKQGGITVYQFDPTERFCYY